MLVDQSPTQRNGGGLDQLFYWLTFWIMFSVILVIDFYTKSSGYADYDSYVLYVNQLVHFPPTDWWYFEALSNYYFLALYWGVESVETTVVLAHYLLGLIFLLFSMKAFPPRTAPWQSLLFLFAMLGPLLAFVTLRASPAYFLVAIAVNYALKRRAAAWVSVALAMFFHTSAALAIPSLLLLFFRDRLPEFLSFNKPVRPIAALVLILLLVLSFGSTSIDFIESTLSSFSVLSKYLVYTDQMGSPDSVTNIGHYIYLLFVVLFTLSYVILPDGNKALNIYVVSSFAVYLALFTVASPVVAVRQTPFWLLPMIAYYPWRRVGVTGPLMLLFVLFCVGLFIFQFDQIYT